jgi:hypothetical protein
MLRLDSPPPNRNTARLFLLIRQNPASVGGVSLYVKGADCARLASSIQ